MRLAILSDIHGNLLALEAVLADLKTRSVDSTVNLGDCVTSPLWPRETLELLDTLDLPTVRGNHDRWIAERTPPQMTKSMQFTFASLSLEQIARLGALPSTLQLGHDVLAVHGTPEDDNEYLLEEIADGRLANATRSTIDRRLGGRSDSLILCGHSHYQHAAHGSANRLVVNPGSVGLPFEQPVPRGPVRRPPWAEYALVSVRQGRVSIDLRRTRIPIEALFESVAKSGMPYPERWIRDWTCP